MLRKPSCFNSETSTTSRWEPAFVALVQCCVGNEHPSATPVLLIFSVCPGPKVMEKIAFSLPLQDLLCPCRARPEAFNQCPDLSRRLPGQSDRLMAPLPALLCPGASPIWDRLQAGELVWELPGVFVG